ncbi:hypothetical protein NPIL_317881 [Nephila pilipes]|uniref:Uncharacterized protein n=1 Tax=Nephila pilipes TaxID=299642 RepID=A0A8X6NN18_NEPPI|nr:hypothetical protein NPIL_317881 [Nephila pilipes]
MEGCRSDRPLIKPSLVDIRTLSQRVKRAFELFGPDRYLMTIDNIKRLKNEFERVMDRILDASPANYTIIDVRSINTMSSDERIIAI